MPGAVAQTATPAAVDAFPGIVRIVIDEFEGGDRLVVDAGGPTRWGIAERYHPSVSVATLTRGQAELIYRREYWDACRCGDMHPAIAFLVFDSAVNTGTTRAVAFLQGELRVEADGVVGPDTLDAAQRAPRTELLVGLTARRLEYYRQEVLRHPPQVVNLNGWTRRACRALVYASRRV